MALEDLASKIWDDTRLRGAVESLTSETVERELGPYTPSMFAPEYDWHVLLRCASVFIQSNSEFFNDIGLRIIHGCLLLSSEDHELAIAATILAKAANNPSIILATQRGLIPSNVLSRLPPVISLDVAAHQIASTIAIDPERTFVASPFQTELWRALQLHDWVSVSAPTSAGKSFILEKWIEHSISKERLSTTFYVVPTRALISQVEADLRSLLERFGSDVAISSLPLAFSRQSPHQIYIYTQERLHLYLIKGSLPQNPNLIIIDEAQQIGSSGRGILLQQVLEMATLEFPDAKVLFATPSTSNPSKLLEFAPIEKSKTSLLGTRPTVNQNVLWVEQVVGTPKTWSLTLASHDPPLPAGRVVLRDRPSSGQKLPFIAYAIGSESGGNIIYVNRAADAEKAAEILCQFIPDSAQDPELVALAELCETAVHPKFKLRRFVLKGVAFHYGNIPQLVRSEIERLFSKGKIRFLVCTSTLVEGVNLACKNVFVRHPKRGPKELMTAGDLWNLAGRAGRWGKEFQGNIFFIDPLKEKQWEGGQAPRFKQRGNISFATQRIRDNFENFLFYANAQFDGLIVGDLQNDRLLSYLLFHSEKLGNLSSSVALADLTADQRRQVSEIVARTADSIGIPSDIVARNPGVNPWGLQALRMHFLERIEERLESLLPIDPLSDATLDRRGEPQSSDAAVQSFIAIFSRVSQYLGGTLGRNETAYGNALLVVDWMRGHPLRRIIDAQLRYWTKRNRRETAVIRTTMERVERVARYETPKFLHAYLDVLKLAAADKDIERLPPGMDDFWLYLEFGVSKRTQLSLMALGLSRSSVVALSDYITDENLNEERSLEWLSSNPWDEFGLPRLVELELNDTLAKHGRPTRALS